MTSLVLEIFLLFSFIFLFWSMGSNNDINSENSCKQRLMRCACISAAAHTKFGGHGLSGFGVKAPFVFIQKWLFGPWTIVHGIGGQKIESAQKIHASRG